MPFVLTGLWQTDWTRMDVLFAERDFIMFVNMKSRHHGTQPAIVIPSFNGGRLHVAIKIWQGGGLCLEDELCPLPLGHCPTPWRSPGFFVFTYTTTPGRPFQMSFLKLLRRRKKANMVMIIP